MLLSKTDTWDGAKGDLWVRRQGENDAFLQPFGDAALRSARVTAGERAVDVGCGCGASTLALAQAVGPRGRITAIDVSSAMLDVAQARARRERLDERIAFVCADASTHGFEAGGADVLYSRFGVMFFGDSIGAFANLRRAMRRGGRMAFVCWQSDEDNAWKRVPFTAALTVLPAPAPRDPEAPGGASFASPERVHSILEGAGWADVRLEPFACNVRLGATIDDAISSVSETTLFGDLIAAAHGEARERALAAVRTAFIPLTGHDGVVVGAAAWIVTAVASG